MTVNLQSVAHAAGVSLTTVSRVLGNRGAVSEATRQRVFEAVESTGYTRSTLLNPVFARLVAVCPPENPEHWQIDVCRSVAAQLQSAGLLVTVPFLDSSGRELSAAIDAGTSLIVTPTFTSLGRGVPVVRLAETALDSAVSAALDAHETLAARVSLTDGLSVAFDHLTALGHRRIGIVVNDSGDLADMLTARFLAEHPQRSVSRRLGEWIAAVPKSLSGGVQAADRLRDATCTALIVQSAAQLHGVFSALRRRRLSIPRDLSVVGVGDSMTMRFTGPPATVLSLDTDELADSLVAAVRSQLTLPGSRMASIPPTIIPRLVARGSTTAVLR